ncbi:procathepsin L-like [Cylas formicarius]|uniref:procathepsin L-like n=1 Tax=Cylas formicarius TaxID=197179 RepID=UPI00295880BE|nr:procathepsin L-like [Cylas formicarius]
MLLVYLMVFNLLVNSQANKIVDFAEQAADFVEQWIKFQLDYAKNYTKQESLFRFAIFKQNLKRIEKHNTKFLQGLMTFKIGLNQFGDLTKEEFIQTLTANPSNLVSKRSINESHRTIRQVPEYFDWREQSAVGSVKNQGNCGSCWSFSAIGALESQVYLKTGKMVSLSEQNLIDCAKDNINHGCQGGWMANAFEYLKNNYVTSDSEYSYVGVQQQCQINERQTKISIRGYQRVQGNEQVLKEAVATIGPITAAMDASNLQFYSNGVYRDDECSPNYVNHGVLIVGYGNEAGRDYWLIKNSWGSSWGENGYFKIIRNRGNQCNLASYTMYPIL